MELFASQDPRSYSFYFDLSIWVRARKVNGTFEKRAPGPWNRTFRILISLPYYYSTTPTRQNSEKYKYIH